MAAGSISNSTSSPHHNHPSHSAGGKAANGLSSTAMNSTHLGGGGGGGGGSVGGMSSGHDGFGGEDGDNRTRNAKAQRRHREKRKAHLKALEESVQVLTSQLEDARRQLGQAAYFSQSGQRAPGAPLSPQSKDFAQLQAENAYLRDENADLRRQVYSYRATYGQAPPVNPDAPRDGPWAGEVKAEQGGFVYSSSSGGVSPRRGGMGQRGSAGDVGPTTNTSLPSTAEGSSSMNSSHNSSYPPPIDHFTPLHQRSRSRVMSSSSAPSASPYLSSDPRAMDARYPPPPNIRYEASQSMYSAPPPHSVPRYDVNHSYTPRQPEHSNVGGDSGQWPSEQIGSLGYVAYPRQAHQSSF